MTLVPDDNDLVIEKFMDDWRGTNDETHLLGINVLIDASMLGSALKIASLGAY